MAKPGVEVRPETRTGLMEKMRGIAIDGVKIAATSGILAFLGISEECSSLSEKIGIANSDTTGLQTALLAFDVGAGVFAGLKERYGVSIAVYAATLIPDVKDIFSGGDLAETGKRFLAKTIVYGGSYALGYILKR